MKLDSVERGLKIWRAALPALVACLLVSYTPCSAAGTQRSLVIDAGSETLGGVTIFINRHGLRMEPKCSSAVIVASEPTWKVVMYNEKNKNGLEMSYEEWLAHTPQMTWIPMQMEHNINLFKQIGEKRYAGLNCKQLMLCRTTQEKSTKGSFKREYLVHDSKLVSAKGLYVMEAILGVPQIDSLPVSLTVTREAIKGRPARQSQLLKATKVEEKMVPSSIFAYPTAKFKKCRREIEVMHDAGTSQLIENFYGPE